MLTHFRCLLTALLDGSAKKGEKAAIITVAKPPSDIHIEVDGETTAAVIVNYPENKERKVNVKKSSTTLSETDFILNCLLGLTAQSVCWFDLNVH